MLDDIFQISCSLSESSEKFNLEYGDSLISILNGIDDLDASWCGSNLGYHANIYYNGLMPKPREAHFSVEWGPSSTRLTGMGSRGDWREYKYEDIANHIFQQNKNFDFEKTKSASDELKQVVLLQKDELISCLSLLCEQTNDDHFNSIFAEIKETELLDNKTLLDTLSLNVPSISRDVEAISAGPNIAPHQKLGLKIKSLQGPAEFGLKLSKIARNASSHMKRTLQVMNTGQKIGKKVFIGHGRSETWRALKDFVENRLKLEHEEFNRVPTAGHTIIERLSKMLEISGFALLVFTAEDEKADGSLVARMNVIHEAGLFQGRLGFSKAIVLLEEGCEEFSNIQGLGQIRFPKGNISACFENVREILERENMISIS